MRTYSFRVIIEGADILRPEALDALFEAGCGDGSFGVSNGIQDADFDREALSYQAAVDSAVADIERAVPGARVVRVEATEELAAG
jgi:hypothetical protein